MKRRCQWVPKGNALYEKYHDEEWGRPIHDDCVLFEFLILESAQAGLSWETVLKKRAAYKKAFANFNVKKVAQFTKHDVKKLMQNAGIIRNRLKIEAAISNAQIFITLQKEYGSFSEYVWSWKDQDAKLLSADMRKRGFRFFGPTICHAYIQAVGIINDHSLDCFLFKKRR
ncbi:MAG: DNA-3-methyladenine glycosylase I [Candidatus Moranbacteria bacterium]|nr:DNA-3-methyladenine glycosylase I [Candidatus Moranbacteria bacterium]